jgi:hypothetical protein
MKGIYRRLRYGHDLVASAAFDWRNPRHRRVLAEDEGDLELAASDVRAVLLTELRAAYRGSGSLDRGTRSAIAQALRLDELYRPGERSWIKRKNPAAARRTGGTS